MKKQLFTLALAAIALGAAAQENIHYQWMEDYYRNVGSSTIETINPRRVDIPGIPGYKAYKADLHMHTIYSDANVTPQMRVYEAVMEGMDILAITDHHAHPRNSFGQADMNIGYDKAKPLADELGLKLIRGFEITGNEPVGHINVLFVKDLNEYRMVKGFKPADCDKVLEKAVAEGAFITTNHPGWPDQDSELSDYIKGHITDGTIKGIEVFNSKEFYPMAIDHAKLYGLTMLSCTDSHYPTYFCFDQEKSHRDFTIIFARDSSDGAIKEALNAGRTLAWADDKIAGSEELLRDFIHACIKVEYIREMGSSIRFRLRNMSDLPFYLTNDRNPRESIYIPAGGYAETKRSRNDLSLSFKVMNTYVSSTEHLELPLSFILDSECEICSPYVTGSNEQFTDNGLDVTLSTCGGQTYYTTDGSTPDASSTLYEGGSIHLDRATCLKAVTVRDGKASKVMEKEFKIAMAQKAKARKHGVRFSYYENDNILSTKDIEPMGELKASGVKPSFDISEGIGRDHFAYIFSGVLSVPESGSYNFILTTNDGSDLFIDGVLACDNDQHNGQATAMGQIYLQKGMHSFRIRYFEGYGDECFTLKWTTPWSSQAAVVPAELLYLE